MELAALATDLALAAAVGGLVGLDRRSAFQAMISQPLVAVSLLGVLLGQAALGLWLGALLQMLWMSSMLFGANTPPNETLASTAIGAMVLLYARHIGTADPPLWTLAILLGVPLGPLGRKVDVRIEQANLRLAERALTAAEAGRPGELGRLPLIAIGRVFAIQALLVASAAAAGIALLALVHPWLSAPVHRALTVVGMYLIPALGLAVALSLVRRRRGLALALGAFVALCLAIEQGTIA